MLATLRQILYPPEFRIAAIGEPDTSTLLATTNRDPDSSGAGIGIPDALLADIGTGLWRIRQKMVEPGTDRPREEVRRAFRHLQSVWDVLAEADVEILDHTDTPFDSGLSLKVLAFQPDPRVSRERIIETIKPSVYLGERRIQMGEVIVATPGTEERPDHGANPTGDNP